MSAYQELRMSLDNVRTDIEFVNLARTLRPRLGGILNWQAGAGALEVELARRFIDSRDDTVADRVFASLFVFAVAAFERYLREAVRERVEAYARRARTFGDLPQDVRTRNLVLTGRLFADSRTPLDYMAVNVEQLAENLATCKAASSEFRLNAIAFSYATRGTTPEAVEAATEGFCAVDFWDEIGRDEKIGRFLQTDGTRETAKAIKVKLREMSKLRNVAAHGGDSLPVFSAESLREYLEFIEQICRRVTEVINASKHRK